MVAREANGIAIALTVDHPSAGQSLTLPLWPSNAVPEVLALLHPAFAHYVAQWEKVADGFWTPASLFPNDIAPARNRDRLTAIVRRHGVVTTAAAGAADLPSADEAGIAPYLWL
jgi:hypothetical protein